MSYKVGDFVVHESSGVCKITDISDMELMGKGSMKTYYTMVPVYKTTAQVFVPLEGAMIRLRDVSSENEIKGLFDGIADIDVIAEPNDRVRVELFKDTMNKFTLEDLASVVKTALLRKWIRMASGKKVMASDEKVLAIAGKKLYEEIAFTLSEDVLEIQNRFEEAVRENSDSSIEKLIV